MEDTHAPHRWEKVTTVGSGLSGQVKWHTKTYDAVYPILQDGFKDWDDGTEVNAGWEPITRKFYVADQRPLDIDYLCDQIKQCLIDDGAIDPTPTDGGGGVGGGAL